MDYKYTCPRCSRKFKSNFWFEIHLQGCKSSLGKIIFYGMSIIAILSLIIGAYSLFLYLNDRVDPRPYLSITECALITQNNNNEVRARIHNTGNKAAKYTRKLTVDDMTIAQNIDIQTIAPNQFSEITLFPISTENFNKKYNFTLELQYWSADNDKRNIIYCLNNKNRYEGDSKHPITIIESNTDCDKKNKK